MRRTTPPGQQGRETTDKGQPPQRPATLSQSPPSPTAPFPPSGPSSLRSQTGEGWAKRQYDSTGQANSLDQSPFTSVGMPATPDVKRYPPPSPTPPPPQQAPWTSDAHDGPSQSHHRSSPLPPSQVAGVVSPTTVNVAMPNRRSSRADQIQPSSFLVGPDRQSSRGASASISTTPGYGLLSLSTTTSAPSSGVAGVGDSSSAVSPSGVPGAHQSPNDPSSSRPAQTPSDADRDRRPKPSLQGFSRSRNGFKYRLVVVQHPTRARMCGFGDKDRRPLSPTLIVKLVIIDEVTGEEVSPWKVNTSLFFLASDLCHPDDLMLSPRNVLVHQHAASIPTAMLQQQQQDQAGTSSGHSSSPYSAQSTRPSSSSNVALPHLGSLYLGDQGRGGPSTSSSDPGPMHPQQSSEEHPLRTPSTPLSSPSAALTTVTTEHYTRNLVGAAVTSASVLKDEQGNHVIFFILQDLSVRTEGMYRIRLMFTDLAQQDGQTNEAVSDALAETYTEPFSVYSPRRFPGMLEPTELSKKLASQGVKIAVRSDKKKRRRDSEAGQGAGGEADELEEEDE